jgi:hypothetical protein
MPAKVQVALTPSQIKFVNQKARFGLFCAGKGAGKSYLMGFMAVTDALHSSNALIGIYEPDYDLIKRVAVPAVQNWMAELGIRGRYNKNDHDISTSNSGCGDFMFKSMSDPQTLVGYETYRQHLDELDMLNEVDANLVFSQLLGRNRQVPKGLPQDHKIWNEKYQEWEAFNATRCYSSPEGFKFCYKNWIESPQPEFEIVQGCTLENPSLSKSTIESQMAGYTEAQKEAWIYGKFVNFDSGTVYYTYDVGSNGNPGKHTSDEFIQPYDTLRIGMDFNVRKMAATIFIVRNGNWHAVEELVDILDTPTMIRIIKDRWQSKDHQIIIYPDASGDSQSALEAGKTHIKMLSDAGFKIRVHKKNPHIKDRVAAVNKAFEDMKVFINKDKCPTVSKSLLQQTYDKNGKPDKNHTGDHQNDATTYPIEYEMGIRNRIIPISTHFNYKRYA